MAKKTTKTEKPFAQAENDMATTSYPQVPLSLLDVNPEQPRKAFSPTAHRELVASIQAQGVLQPLVVRPIEGGRYQIVAGERRYRAAKDAPLEAVPVIVKDISDEQQVTAIALIENLQREALDPIEVAQSFGRLRDDGYSQAEIAQLVSKTAAYVSQSFKLLKASPGVTEAVKAKDISAEDAIGIVRESSRSAVPQEELLEPVKVRNTERKARVAAARKGKGKGVTVTPSKLMGSSHGDAILTAIDFFGLGGTIGFLATYCEGRTHKGWAKRAAVLRAAEAAVNKLSVSEV